MKAKIYILILLALMLTGFRANAQRDNAGDYRNGDSKVIINNYYDNYDYYYSSRINRFHRSYSHFNYYAPVFTDAYWYSYQPYTWGISIYGGEGFGFGYSQSYPVYSYRVAYNSGWQAPYFGSSFYWGYDPFYYNRWYVTPAISISFGGYWPHTYYGYNGHDHHYSQHYYEVSQARNGYNTSGYSTRGHPSDRSSGHSTNSYSESNRRDAGTSGYRTGDSHSGNSGNAAANSGTSRRKPGTSVYSNVNNGNNGTTGNHGNHGNNGNSGNNINSRENGNNSNNVNNGNNVNSRTNGNNSSSGAARSSKGGSDSPSSFSNINRNTSRSRYPLTDPAKRSSTQSNGKSSKNSNSSDSRSPKSSTSSDKPDRRR